mgnify:CR=1 FL=1
MGSEMCIRDSFRKVIQLAAQHKIAVVAHEPIKDTGERRTFPNMVSREGARGQEYNAWSADGGNPPDHETVLPFTRGPVSYTHLRAHETVLDLVCRLLLEKKKYPTAHEPR